jgi:NAD(P)-dependent dehydrogenase (short-subunit alcohol dehydrogenase family)
MLVGHDKGADMAGQGILAGKVAIVTGAGSRAEGIGNGKATAVLFAREGARVGLVDAHRDRAEETRSLIAAEAGESFTIEADVSDADACRDVVELVVARYGAVHILANYVGVEGALGNAVDADVVRLGMRINVKSMMLMAKYCIPEMEKAGSGAIVNMSSVGGLLAGHPSLLYPTSKGAVVMMTKAMAFHHGPRGIRVNCIAPGLLYTPNVTAQGLSPEMREARRHASMLDTEGTGWDVAHTALFLVSDAARWITGVTIPVDAGFTSKIVIPNPAFDR